MSFFPPFDVYDSDRLAAPGPHLIRSPRADSDACRPKHQDQAVLREIPRRERETWVDASRLDPKLDFQSSSLKGVGLSTCELSSVFQKSPDIHLDPYVHALPYVLPPGHPYTYYLMCYCPSGSGILLNHHPGSIHYDSKAFSSKRWERFAVAVRAHAVDYSLSAAWLSAPLLASRMHISGSDSRTGEVEPRPNGPGTGVRWDENRIERRGSVQDTASVR